MTILPKPKLEKIPLPFGLNGGLKDDVAMLRALQQRAPPPHYDDNESMIFNKPRPCSLIRTCYLFLIAIIMMMMGILGGYTLYRMYLPMKSGMHMHALCDIPYMGVTNRTMPRFYASNGDEELIWNWRNILPSFGEDKSNELFKSEAYDAVNMLNDDFFREEIDLDMSGEDSVAKVNVPDFRDGRSGRFMHDFKENQSAIIDTTANRCFVMQLDRDTTLPPTSFMDLVQKMGSGYYNIDTERVRRNMRVVTPPIKDLTSISERIANECYDMKVYKLETYVSGVFKRSVNEITPTGKFAEFMGKGIVEYNLMNIEDIEEFERLEKK